MKNLEVLFGSRINTKDLLNVKAQLNGAGVVLTGRHGLVLLLDVSTQAALNQ